MKSQPSGTANAEGHKATEARVREFVEARILRKQPFTDTDFPPSKASLYNSRQDDLNSAEIAFYESLVWKRLSEIYPTQRMVKRGTYRTTHLRQGKAGCQYFVAVLGSLTNHDERIDKLLITKDVNAAGIYQVKMFVNGLRTSIVVDDHVPFDP